MRKQILDSTGGMSLDPREHVREVCDWIHAVFLARGDERVEHRVIVTRFLVTDEEVIRPPDSLDRANMSLPPPGGSIPPPIG